MALSYIYVIQSKMLELHGEVDWAGTQKWRAQEYLKELLEEGISLGNYRITRIKDGQSHTKTELDPYEFMQIDLGEVL